MWKQKLCLGLPDYFFILFSNNFFLLFHCFVFFLQTQLQLWTHFHLQLFVHYISYSILLNNVLLMH